MFRAHRRQKTRHAGDFSGSSAQTQCREQIRAARDRIAFDIRLPLPTLAP